MKSEGVFLRVKNWPRYQHYKDRNPPWIKLYTALLDDYEFGRLQDASKAHAICLMALAGRMDNHLPKDASWLGKKISATTDVDLDGLLSAEFLEVCDCASCKQAECARSASGMLALARSRETETETETEDTPAPSPPVSEPKHRRAPTPEDDSPAFLRFPVTGDPDHPEWTLTTRRIESFAETYPTIDVEASARQALGWCRENRRKRKTAGGMENFLGGWFRRDIDKGRNLRADPGGCLPFDRRTSEEQREIERREAAAAAKQAEEDQICRHYQELLRAKINSDHPDWKGADRLRAMRDGADDFRHVWQRGEREEAKRRLAEVTPRELPPAPALEVHAHG